MRPPPAPPFVGKSRSGQSGRAKIGRLSRSVPRGPSNDRLQAGTGHPLDSANAKLSRAREHLEALHSEVMSSEGRDAYTGEITFDAATGWHTLKVRVHRPLPARLGGMVGDVANNLRAALDHAVYGIAWATTGVPAERSQFPISDTPGAFRTSAGRDLGDLPVRWIDVIKALQPFADPPATGRHVLAVLRDLANADKHRLIPAAMAVPIEHRLQLEPAAPLATDALEGAETWVAPRGPVEDGDSLLGFRLVPPSSARLRVAGSLKLEVAFGPELVTWSDLDAVRRHVGEIVATLEEALARAPLEKAG